MAHGVHIVHAAAAAATANTNTSTTTNTTSLVPCRRAWHRVVQCWVAYSFCTWRIAQQTECVMDNPDALDPARSAFLHVYTPLINTTTRLTSVLHVYTS